MAEKSDIQEYYPGPTIPPADTIPEFAKYLTDTCRIIKEKGLQEAGETCAPEILEVIAPPTSLKEALKLARGYCPGSVPLTYLELDFPDISPDKLSEAAELLLNRTERVFGPDIRKILDILLNGEIVNPEHAQLNYEPIVEIIYNIIEQKASRDHRQELDMLSDPANKQEAIRIMRIRMLQSARFMLYSVSYDPYPNREKQWFGCPVGPDEFLASIIFTALNTPCLKNYLSYEALNGTRIDNYINLLKFHSPLTNDSTITISRIVKNAMQTRSNIQSMKGDDINEGVFESDNLYGTYPGALLKLSAEERIDLLREVKDQRTLSIIAIDSITTLITIKTACDEDDRGLSGIQIAELQTEARLGFFVIGVLCQGWIDGVIIEYLLDESFRTMCPYKYDRALAIARTGMAFNISGAEKEIHIGPWTNEDVVLTWATSIYIKRVAQLFLRNTDLIIQEQISIINWIAARPKGILSLFLKSITDRGTEFPPPRLPITYNDWRARAEGYRNPYAYTFDIMGTILVLSFPQTSDGITLVQEFFRNVIKECPFMEESYIHLRYADPRNTALYFSIHTAFVVSLSSQPIGRHSPHTLNVVEVHLPGGVGWQAMYGPQHLLYALTKFGIADQTLEQLYNDTATLVFVYAKAAGIQPHEAVSLLISSSYPYTITINGEEYIITPDLPDLAVAPRHDRPLMRGGLLYDLIAKIPNVTDQQIIALIRCAPSISIQGQNIRTLVYPYTLQQQVTFMALERTGQPPREVRIITDLNTLIEEARIAASDCFSFNVTNELINNLTAYFHNQGDEWYLNLLRQNPHNLIETLRTHFGKGYQDDAVDETRRLRNAIYVNLLALSSDLRKGNRLLQIVIPIIFRSARYNALQSNPTSPSIEMRRNELINLIVTGCSSQQKVRDLVENHIRKSISIGLISANFLYSCTIQASKLFTGTGDNPISWIDSIITNPLNEIDNVFFEQYLSLMAHNS